MGVALVLSNLLDPFSSPTPSTTLLCRSLPPIFLLSIFLDFLPAAWRHARHLPLRKPRSERATCLGFCPVSLLRSSWIPPLTPQTRLHHRSPQNFLPRLGTPQGALRKLRKYLSPLAQRWPLLPTPQPFLSPSQPLRPQPPFPVLQAGPTHSKPRSHCDFSSGEV